MKVDKEVMWEALRNFERVIGPYQGHKFLNMMGITVKQWVKFKHTGKLKVSKTTAAKLKCVAMNISSPYRKTLLKVLEIRNGR